jgi:hypothetical protein
MGALDDAIREHLELKRRLGAAEDELKRKEDEAFGRRSALGGADEPGRQPPAAASEASAIEHEEVLEGVSAEPAASEPAAASPEPPEPAIDAAELEPDEVLPEESLELEHALVDEPPAADGAAAPDWERLEQANDEPSEDLLEETPDFLEETPEQDRLWFEQRPPKDFDFGD